MKHLTLSQYVVLINQSDSHRPHQFWVIYLLHKESKLRQYFALPIHNTQIHFQRNVQIASDRFRAQQRIPAPRSQSQFFSRCWKSLLPTSLSYIYLFTRGCSPLRPDAVISTCRYGQSIHTDSNEQLTVHLAHGMITCLASKLTIANTNQIKPCVTVEKKSERLPGKNATTRAHIVSPLYIHLLAVEHVQCFISCTMINYNSTDQSYISWTANPCPIDVHMEPIPPRSSYLLNEWLLLPPRSAAQDISCRLQLHALTYILTHPPMQYSYACAVMAWHW